MWTDAQLEAALFAIWLDHAGGDRYWIALDFYDKWRRWLKERGGDNWRWGLGL